MASITKRSVHSSAGTRPKYDVRYRDPHGVQRSRTFRTLREAERFARKVEVDKETGSYVDPSAGQVTLDAYAQEWLDNRPTLRPRTRDLYEGQLDNHILPVFGATQISKITPPAVRSWWAEVHRGKLSEVSCAKVYRLLRAILTTAETDGLIIQNPCRIAGAGIERSDERPVATVEQVWKLADAVPPRLRCMVLVFGFVGLRLGEALALERRHLDLRKRTLRVEQQEQELRDGTIIISPPKTRSGIRTLAIPEFLVNELHLHLEQFVGPAEEDRLFTGAGGGPLRRAQWKRTWDRAKVDVADLQPGFRSHDLRHTANTIAAATGASTRELMQRMGHASSEAALRYQHATTDRDRAIADLIGDLVVDRAPNRGR